MIVHKKSPSSYMCRAGMFFALIFALLQPAIAAPETTDQSEISTPDSIISALQSRNFERAEQEARLRLARTDSAQVTSQNSNDSNNAGSHVQTVEKRKSLMALATVLGARAWDADLRSRSSRITGNDVLLLVVVTLFAGGIVALLIRYGPQRPKLVEQTEQWMAKVQSEHRDDGFKQAGAALYSLLILGLLAGAMFVAIYLLMHLVAELDSPSREGPDVRKFYDEAKLVMVKARDPDWPPVIVEDYDVLGLYAAFLRKTGDPRQAAEVERRIRAMQVCGPGKLPQKTR